jgi:uncharacterized MAPEG superfamily protein
MLSIILLVIGLFVLQTLLPAAIRYAQGPDLGRKLWAALGPRDQPPPQTVIGARAERALANMQEALPVFLALALLNLILGTAASMAVTGATLFFVARLLYVPAYLLGVPVLRTLIWMAGMVGLVMMLIPLLQRI